MIKHFKKITGTGKFLNFHWDKTSEENAPSDFKKFNVIYGDNGSGKTTLALLLRSLKGDADLLLKKRSFDKTVPQEVELEMDLENDGVFSFSKNQWNRFFPQIEIFDIHFINENVYTGFDIESSHKKKLFEIILGEQGVRLKNEIAVLKERVRKGNKVIRESSKILEANIDGAFSALEYAEVKPIEDIVEQLKFKAQELETAQNHEAIIAKPSLKSIPNLVFPLEKNQVTGILEQSIDNISEAYLAQFKAHKNQLKMNGKEEEWIQQGFENIHDENCPFCLQKINSTVEIVEAYQQYFNQTYNNLLTDLSNANSKLNHYNLEAQILDMENVILGNLTLIDFWKQYIHIELKLDSILDKKEDLLNAFEAVKTVFSKKTKNPVQSIEGNEWNDFEEKMNMLQSIGEDYNNKIANFNESIELLKSANQPNVPQIELEQKKLLAIQKRGDAEIEEVCKNLKTYSDAVVRFKNEMKDKQAQLDIFKGTVFLEYLQKVNQHLRDFAPYLQLKNLTSGYLGSSTEPVVKFALQIQDNEISQKENTTQPSVKYALSEGDKSALALSFFLTKLEMDENLSQKIIVLDDPVASFDAARKGMMIQKLIDFGIRANQVFLITHDKFLVSRFWKKSKERNLETHCYQIGFEENSSVLLPLRIA